MPTYAFTLKKVRKVYLNIILVRSLSAHHCLHPTIEEVRRYLLFRFTSYLDLDLPIFYYCAKLKTLSFSSFLFGYSFIYVLLPMNFNLLWIYECARRRLLTLDSNGFT